jgi:hypothetical protein
VYEAKVVLDKSFHQLDKRVRATPRMDSGDGVAVGDLDIEGITWLDILRRKRKRKRRIGHGGDRREE